MVGQLFVTYVYGSGPHTVTPAQREANLALYGEPTPAAVLRRWHLGGIILLGTNNLDASRPQLSTGNLAGPRQLRALTTGLQRVAHDDTGLALLIGTDQEGGIVQHIPFLPNRASQQSLARRSPAALTCSYHRLGNQLAALGVNQDYAPVADVDTVRGGVIGDRSFGPDPGRDAVDVRAAVRGLQSAGVLATLKHWPGHGSTRTDSHARLAVIHESAGQWRRVDRVPFAAAAATAAATMVGHLALPALDPTGRPATLSPVLNRFLLRRRLGYRGLVITDSLSMQPARAAGTPASVAVRAIAAGNDMLLMPADLPSAWHGLLHAVRTNPRLRADVRTALGYVTAAKARIGRRQPVRCH